MDSPTEIIFSLIKLIGVLAITVGIAYLVLHKGLPKFFPQPKTKHLKIIEKLPLDFKRSLYLVRVGGQALVIASSENQINKIAAFPASDLGISETTTTSNQQESGA